MPKVEIEDQPVGIICEKCGREMVLKHGRFGKFVACSNFPTCKNTKPWFERIGVKCPNCNAELLEKRTRKGRIFYGCENYPTCNFSTWKKPLVRPCPACGGLLVIQNRLWAQCINCEERFALDYLKKLPDELQPDSIKT